MGVQRVRQVQVAFIGGSKRLLRGVLYVPNMYSTAVICAHGYPGDSSGGTARHANFLAKRGYLVFRFDFTGCGASDGKHEERLLSADVRDIRGAIDFLSAHAEFSKLVLFGHSTGAVTVPFVASDRRVSAIILSAGQAYLDRGARYDFSDRQVRELWTKGYTLTPWPMQWSGRRERILKKFYDEFFTLDLPKALRKIHKPTLVVHGELDEAVPLQCAKDAYILLSGKKKLAVISGADHRYRSNTSGYYAELLSFLASVSRGF